MTPNERVKKVRKNVSLSQEEFGKKLGITKASVSRIESGVHNLSPQMAKLICKEFGISEPWLRDGAGPMFHETTREEEIAEYMGDLLSDDEEDNVFLKQFIKMLSKLDVNDWKTIQKIVNEMTKEKD